eukprot:2301169-Pleurochrysis_carterae.AAC.3
MRIHVGSKWSGRPSVGRAVRQAECRARSYERRFHVRSAALFSDKRSRGYKPVQILVLYEVVAGQGVGSNQQEARATIGRFDSKA